MTTDWSWFSRWSTILVRDAMMILSWRTKWRLSIRSDMLADPLSPVCGKAVLEIEKEMTGWRTW